MVNFNTQNQMISYISSEFNFEPNISIVVSKKYLDDIISQIDFDYKMLTKEIFETHDTYQIEKNEDDDMNLYIVVQPIEFDGDGMVSEIDNDFVIVQAGLLDKYDIAQIFADEELTIVDYEEDCNCECYQGYEVNENLNDVCEKTGKSMLAIGNAFKSIFPRIIEEHMEEKLQEFEEMLSEISDDEEFCMRCTIKKLMTDIYIEAYNNGYENGKNSMVEELENLLDRVTE